MVWAVAVVAVSAQLTVAHTVALPRPVVTARLRAGLGELGEPGPRWLVHVIPARRLDPVGPLGWR